MIQNITSLAGKVALVTGAGKGIGRGIAVALGEQGASIIVMDLVEDRADDTTKILIDQGYPACSVTGDVRYRNQIEACLQRGLQYFGKVDILVNNAGVLTMGSALDLSEEDWDLVLDVNLKGTFLCCQVIGKYFAHKANGGAIINISSVAGKKGFENQLHYSASKAAVINLTRVLAVEFASFKVRVNAVCPGAVETELFDQCLNWEAERAKRPADQLLNDWMQPVLIKRLIQPVEIGRIVAFLASDAASIITAQAINADGGSTPC